MADAPLSRSDRLRNALRTKVGGRASAWLQLIDRKAAKGAIRFARFYQRNLQPESGCLYNPVCSDYGIAAFQNHGFHDGIIMAAKRIQRCNPTGKDQYFALHPELGDSVHGNDPCPGRGRLQHQPTSVSSTASRV